MPVLPSHILNILWDDVYPRVVPFIWEHEANGESIDRSGNVPAIGGDRFAYQDIRPRGTDEDWGVLILIRAIDDLRAWATFNTPEYTQEFRDAVSLLRNYLWGPVTIDQVRAPSHALFNLDIDGDTLRNESPFPVRFIPGYGFDFVLSNEGLDLALPPNPELPYDYKVPMPNDVPVGLSLGDEVLSRHNGVNFGLQNRPIEVWNSTDDNSLPGQLSQPIAARRRPDELKIYQYYSYRRVGSKPMLIPRQVRRVANFWQNTMGMTALQARVAARAANSASSNPTAGNPPSIRVQPNAVLNWLEVGEDVLEMVRFHLGDVQYRRLGVNEVRDMRGDALENLLAQVRRALPSRPNWITNEWLDQFEALEAFLESEFSNLADSEDDKPDPSRGRIDQIVEHAREQVGKLVETLKSFGESRELPDGWMERLEERRNELAGRIKPGMLQTHTCLEDIVSRLHQVARPRGLPIQWLGKRNCIGEIIMQIVHGAGEVDSGMRWREYIWELSAQNATIEVSYHGYLQLNRGHRRWQLTGDLYSHILQEMPRVFAEIWREDQLEAGYGMHPAGKLYSNQYSSHARQIYMERIEAWIPEGSEMHFRLSRCPEVIIADGGLLIPVPPPPPEMEDMFDEWKTGEAINPVFTDTHSFK